MSGSKYFVWASGRWREIDITSGAVEGWSKRARFVYERRGRLHIAKRRKVLVALQDLIKARPSAAGIGPRLSLYREELEDVRRASPPHRERHNKCHDHHHCCMHNNVCHNGHNIQSHSCHSTPSHPALAPVTSSQTVTQRTVVDVAVQHVTHVAQVHASADRQDARERSASSDDFVETHRAGKRKRSDTESHASDAKSVEECRELVVSPGDVAALRSFVSRRRPGALARYDADESYRRALFYAINPLVVLRRCALTRRALARAARDFAANLGLRPATPASTAPPVVQRASRRIAKQRDTVTESSSDDTDKENYVTPTERRVSRSTVKTNSDENRNILQKKHTSVRNIHSKRNYADKPESDSSEGHTVSLQKNNQVLKRDSFRKLVEVHIKPDQHSANTKLAEKGTASSVNTKKLAEKVTASTPITKKLAEKVTASPANTKKLTDRLTTQSANTKKLSEGVTTAPVVHDEKIQSNSRVVVNEAKEKQTKRRVPPAVEPHTISKQAFGSRVCKEYSNLEDHAIVSWLSAGSRAQRVNGNALWKELQEQYQRITGQARSWHSLRNRYLRYILPALGALQLPPGDVTRLRAAAATGEIKRKVGDPSRRRQSIFKEEVVRGASTRVPKSTSDSSVRSKSPAATTHRRMSPPPRKSLRTRSPRTEAPSAKSPPAKSQRTVSPSPRTKSPSERSSRTVSPRKSLRTKSPSERSPSPEAPRVKTLRTRSSRDESPRTKSSPAKSRRTVSPSPRSKSLRTKSPRKSLRTKSSSERSTSSESPRAKTPTKSPRKSLRTKSPSERTSSPESPRVKSLRTKSILISSSSAPSSSSEDDAPGAVTSRRARSSSSTDSSSSSSSEQEHRASPPSRRSGGAPPPAVTSRRARKLFNPNIVL